MITANSIRQQIAAYTNQVDLVLAMIEKDKYKRFIKIDATNCKQSTIDELKRRGFTVTKHELYNEWSFGPIDSHYLIKW